MFYEDFINSYLDATEYKPTAEQRNVVHTIAKHFYQRRTSRSIIVVTAVAGAGKTATCLDVYNVLTHDLAHQYIQFCAFNVKAKDEMMAHTDLKQAPWYVVDSEEKKRARLNCIRHLLSVIPYEDLPREKIELPARKNDAGYVRPPLGDQTMVRDWYADVGGEKKK